MKKILFSITIVMAVILLTSGAWAQGADKNVEKRVTALESKVLTLQSQVASLQTENSTLRNQVNTLQGQVNSLNSTVSNLQTQVNVTGKINGLSPDPANPSTWPNRP